MNMRSQTVRWTVGIIAAITIIVILRLKPWQKVQDPDLHIAPGSSAKQSIEVAFIPVTCHLTCPITDFASKTSETGTRFDARRFSEFPTIVESLKSKKILAGFLTVPLAMKLREQKVPVRICCLGHRDGSQIVIRKENGAKSLADLKGKTIAIPSFLSNENFVFHKVMREQGLKEDDIKFIVLPPPDMNTALATKSIDGFFVAEPFCSKSELDGTGRVLYYGKDLWPNYISCCLVVHEDLIKTHPEIVKDLVRGILQSGEWAETNRADAAKLAAGPFRQDEKLLKYILTANPKRVSYRMLNPTDDELQKIMDMGLQIGQLKMKTSLAELMDRDYIPQEIHAAVIDMSKVGKIN